MTAVRDAERDAPGANRPRARSETLVFDRGRSPTRARSETLVFDRDRDRAPARARSETLVFDRTRALARPGSEAVIDAPLTLDANEDLTGVTGDGDPARAAELAALEERIATVDEPDALVAIATQVDTLGMELAFEISRHAHDEAHVAPLKPVLMRVPMLYGRALVRAAEKFDDLGSPKRAVYVLFEALRKAFDPEVIASVTTALSFVLDAHGQGTAAQRLSDLVAVREEQRAAGMDRKEVRAQFSAALEQVRDRAVDWSALADDAPQFD